MNKSTYFLGGVCWLVFSIVLGCFLISFLSNGAGLSPFADAVSPGGVLMGLIPTIALLVGSLVCFTMGAYLCVRAFAGESGGQVEPTEVKSEAEHPAGGNAA